MVWVDYDREWKKYQIEFNKLEVKLTKEQIDAGPRARSTRPSAKALEAADRPGRAGDRGPRRRGRKAQAEADQLKGEWYARRPELPVHQGQDRRGALRLRRGRARREGAAPPTKKADLDDLEKQWSDYRAASSRRSWPSGDAAAASSPSLEKTQGSTRRRRRRSSSPSKTRLDDKLRKIEPGFVTLRAQPAHPRPREPVAEGQPDHAREPPRRRDLHRHARRWTAARPATWASTRRATRTAPQPYTHAPEPRALPARARTPSRGSAARPATRAAAAPPASRTPSTPPSTAEQEKDWGKYIGTKEYERWHHWDLPMTAKGTHRVAVRASATRAWWRCRRPSSSTPASCSSSATAASAATRSRAGRDLRKVGPRPHEDHDQDQRGVDLPLGQGAAGLPPDADAADLGRADRRDRRPEGAQRRRDQRGGGLPRRAVGERGLPGPARRATWTPAARPSRPSAASPATASATTSAGSRAPVAPPSAPTDRTSTAPAAR